MAVKLRVLIVEDSLLDAELVIRALQKGGIDPDWHRVETEAQFKRELEKHPDVILADYNLPQYSALEALETYRASGYDIPFIVLSGTVGDEVVVTTMRAGAHDYVLKDNLHRLGPAVLREVKEAQTRSRRHDIERRLTQAEDRFFKAFHASPIAFAIATRDTGYYVDINDSFLRLTGYERDEVIGHNVYELGIWANPAQRREAIERLLVEGMAHDVEAVIRTRSGDLRDVLVYWELIDVAETPCLLGIIHDMTERKAAEAALRVSERQFRLLAENSTDLISLHTPDGEYLYASPSSKLILGYDPDVLIGHSVYEYFHPDDVPAVRVSHETILESAYITTLQYRTRRSEGDYVWMESTLRTIRDETGAAVEIQAATRDISERKRAEESLRRFSSRVQILHEIDQGILWAQSPEPIAEAVFQRLPQLIPVNLACLYVFDFNTRQATALAVLANQPTKLAKGDTCPMAYFDRPLAQANAVDPHLICSIAELEELGEREMALAAEGIEYFVDVPLISRGSILGCLMVAAESLDAFSQEYIEIVVGLAAQIAIAIENARLLEVERKRAEELEILRQASLELTSRLELEPVVDAILDQAMRVVEAEGAHVFLYDGSQLTFGTAFYDGERRSQPYREPRPQGLTYTVAKTGEPVIVSNVNEDPLYEDWKWGGSIVGLPLRTLNRVTGVMTLAFNTPHPLSQEEMKTLQLLADQAAIAVRNAQLYEQVQRHAEELEARVNERTEQLRLALDKEKELNRLKSNFVSMVSHEFRTPLASIQTATDLLRHYADRVTAERRQTAFEQIQAQIWTLTSLLEDVLMISRADSVGLQATAAPTDFQRFCADMIAEIKDVLGETHRFILEVSGEPVPVNIDPQMFRHVLVNLLSNAVKYSADGTNVTISLGYSDVLELRVSDEGIGIPEDDLPHLFDVFYRGKNVGTVTGTGLGMPIVKHVVEAHGGTIYVDSTVGKGTTFTVYVPLRAAEAKQQH